MSLVRSGSERFGEALRWDTDDLVMLFALLITPFSALRADWTEVVGY